MPDWFSSNEESRGADSNNNNTAEQSDDIPFCSRRSPILCRNGCVASSQPLASSIGLDMLRQGANAAEAAIAVAGALCVTEPCSTGLGGDMFCLYYDAKTRRVSCINGSGMSPAGLSLDLVRKDCSGEVAGEVDPSKFMFSPHAVTVPGAAKGYEDLLRRHGSGNFTLKQLLEPAAKLAEEGFPVTPITSYHWRNGVKKQIAKWVDSESDETIPLTVDGKVGPMPGDVMKNPDLARVLRALGEDGAEKGFYKGWPGQAIVATIQKFGGTMTMDDLSRHQSTYPEPISANYRDIKLWQVPPNGQGIAGLIALEGLAHLEATGGCPKITPKSLGTADSYHVMMEMMRLGFADTRKYVSDPRCVPVSLDWLLDPSRIGSRATELFDSTKAKIAGTPLPSSCTVSFQVVDAHGNAISFVNSNFMGFGTGIVPKGCGFTLQNRGFGFTTDDTAHPNVVAGEKRPYHTIIPGMITHTDTNELHSTISNMGGNMQPQGHLQLTVGMVAGNLDPQAAVDFPRFCITDGTQNGKVQLEAGVAVHHVSELKRRGHDMVCNVVGHDRAIFGRAQIIQRNRRTGVLWAGSDGRADGCAMGY